MNCNNYGVYYICIFHSSAMGCDHKNCEAVGSAQKLRKSSVSSLK